MKTQKMSTQSLVLCAIMTALVIILQFMGAFIKLGPFSISLVLVPIVIGAALCGVGAGAWLGFVFGVVVLLSGDAAAFLAVNVPGTILTVLVKGTACGFLAGLTYRLFAKRSTLVATLASACVCPIVNTGVFLIGCFIFFMDTVTMWAEAAELGANVGQYMIVVLVGANFLFELLFNIILSPIIVRLLKINR